MMTCDSSHHRRERRTLDQFLGEESLTSDLVDEAARIVLDWGMAELEAVLQPTEALSRAQLIARMARLRRMMKRVNDSASQVSADQQAERVRLLLSRLEEGGDTSTDDEAG